MKKIIILLLLSSSTIAQVKINDKALHVYAGIAVSSSVGAFAYHKTKNPLASTLIGFAGGCLIGIGKEAIYDKMLKRGVCDNQDAYKTFWGSAIGSLCLRVGIDIKQKHDVEKEYFENLRDSMFVEKLTDN